MIGFFLCHKIIIILLFLLVRVFSFLSVYLVNDKIKIVIVASEVAKVETIQKMKNDVRKNTRQKKIIDIEIKKKLCCYFLRVSRLSRNLGGQLQDWHSGNII